MKEPDGGYTAYCPELELSIRAETAEDAISEIKILSRFIVDTIGVEGLKLGEAILLGMGVVLN
jgi:predicted RNase H-like HicB family nuclease